MDVHLRALAAGQYDILAAWQLMAAGATRRMIDHRVETHGWRVVHRGVHALTNAPLTQPESGLSRRLRRDQVQYTVRNLNGNWRS